MRQVGWTRRLCWVAFGAFVAALGVADVGAAVDVWEWMPAQIHSMLTSGVAVTVIVLGVIRYIGPTGEAYRLGMSAGERMQRERCTATCGHSCGQREDSRREDDRRSHLHMVAAAVGDDSTDNVSSRHFVARARATGHRNSRPR